jgi:hypothetical protein
MLPALDGVAACPFCGFGLDRFAFVLLILFRFYPECFTKAKGRVLNVFWRGPYWSVVYWSDLR